LPQIRRENCAGADYQIANKIVRANHFAASVSVAISMMSALREGSPNSFNPRIANATTSAGKLRDISKLIGKSVNIIKVHDDERARGHVDPRNAKRE